jgi:A/G-specific adenine glycosylase
MDLGATICTPKRPVCALCPWHGSCAAEARGEAEAFPRRTPKPEGALRRGAAFVARRSDGYLLLRTRPPRGLLGGMTEVPTSAWTAEFEEADALKDAPRFSLPRVGGKNGKKIAWHRVPGVVRHVFTHFPLELVVYAADVPARVPAPNGARWVALDAIAGEALPSLIRKVIAHGLKLD